MIIDYIKVFNITDFEIMNYTEIFQENSEKNQQAIFANWQGNTKFLKFSWIIQTRESVIQHLY